MKKSLNLLAIIGVLFAGIAPTSAADNKTLAGPKGGRLLERTEPKAEFYLEKDHSVTVLFYDSDLKPVSVTGQIVKVIADAKSGKATIDFEKKDNVLISKEKLPEGDGYNIVIQLRQNADAKPQNFRFKLETHTCAGCQRPEYACSCHE